MYSAVLGAGAAELRRTDQVQNTYEEA